MIVGNGQVRMDPIKVQGIAQWPTPSCVKDMRSFLGFCNFYRAFIPDFSNIARPLNNLTCKNRQWDWLGECEQAFLHLKTVCTQEPVLKTPDVTILTQIFILPPPPCPRDPRHLSQPTRTLEMYSLEPPSKSPVHLTISHFRTHPQNLQPPQMT